MWKTMILTEAIFLLLFQATYAMLYKESLNIDDVLNIFKDEECIDGTLSSFEYQQPILKVVSEAPSYNSDNSKIKSNSETKSPLNSVHELASHNNILYHYKLTEEHGPAHKKRFVVNLVVGEESYQGEGQSIKKAQQDAARLALNSTLYKHPPQNPVNDKSLYNLKKTSVQKLSEWVTKYSDAKVVYHYSQHSKYVPEYHESFYHPKGPESISRVIVHINDDQFAGEGLTFGEAKENAAREALKNLRNIHGMCLLSEGERGLLNKVFYNYEDESPVSLVNEFASKTQTEFSFNLISEEGPAHLKNFVFKCNVGNLESYGEGSSKKSAKTDAAEKMVEILRAQTAKNSGSCSILTKKPKSKSPKNIIKSQVKTFNNEEEYNGIEVDEKLDPVSKLYQIHQKTRGPEPVFRFLSETGKNSFSVEVVMGDFSYIGSGQNKKAAKKKAAEGILLAMGYSTDDTTDRKSKNFKNSRVNFNKFKRMKSTPIGAGLSLNSKNIHDSVKVDYNYNNPSNLKKDKDKSWDSTNFQHKPSKTFGESSTSGRKNEKSFVNAKAKLETLSQNLGFKFQFSDFPKNDTGFLTLLSLTTDPAKVCYGIGETIDSSQERAALSALENIYKTELASISEILRQPKLNDMKENVGLKKIQMVEIKPK